MDFRMSSNLPPTKRSVTEQSRKPRQTDKDTDKNVGKFVSGLRVTNPAGGRNYAKDDIAVGEKSPRYTTPRPTRRLTDMVTLNKEFGKFKVTPFASLIDETDGHALKELDKFIASANGENNKSSAAHAEDTQNVALQAALKTYVSSVSDYDHSKVRKEKLGAYLKSRHPDTELTTFEQKLIDSIPLTRTQALRRKRTEGAAAASTQLVTSQSSDSLIQDSRVRTVHGFVPASNTPDVFSYNIGVLKRESNILTAILSMLGELDSSNFLHFSIKDGAEMEVSIGSDDPRKSS